MNAVVRNGCCEIRGGAGKPRVTLPPMNIDEAILHRDHVAVVLRNGYCQLYNTEGKLVATHRKAADSAATGGFSTSTASCLRKDA